MLRRRLRTIATGTGYAIVLGGSILIVGEHPVATFLLVGLVALGILILTAWYDDDHWKGRYLRWRHADVLIAAAALTDPHLDRLAHELGTLLKWDGRSDYLWGPWIQRSQEFVDTSIIPALGMEQRRIVADCGPILREQIRSAASGRAFERAQQLGLVK